MSFKFSIDKQEKPNSFSSFMGGVLCICLSAFGFYVVLSDKTIEGGIPFIPDAINSLLGMIALGTGAVITGILGVYAFYEFFKLRK